jgi:hypothetical protein
MQSTIFWQATPGNPVNFTDVSEERTSSIFGVEQGTSKLQADHRLPLI